MIVKRCRALLALVILIFAISALAAVRISRADDPEWARVRLVHAVPGGPLVDVFVDNEEIVGDVQYKDVTPYESLSAGPHTIEVKLSFPSITLISETVVLSGGMDITVAGVGQGLTIEAVDLEDDNSPSNSDTVRFVHLSPDTAPIDIAVKETLVYTVAGNIPYKGASDYVGGLGPGPVSLEVRPVGQITPLLTFSRTIEPDRINTLFVVGHSTPPGSLLYPLEVVHTVDRRFFWIFLPTTLKNS
jgi:hypothetical protein